MVEKVLLLVWSSIPARLLARGGSAMESALSFNWQLLNFDDTWITIHTRCPGLSFPRCCGKCLNRLWLRWKLFSEESSVKEGRKYGPISNFPLRICRTPILKIIIRSCLSILPDFALVGLHVGGVTNIFCNLIIHHITPFPARNPQAKKSPSPNPSISG